MAMETTKQKTPATGPLKKAEHDLREVFGLVEDLLEEVDASAALRVIGRWKTRLGTQESPLYGFGGVRADFDVDVRPRSDWTPSSDPSQRWRPETPFVGHGPLRNTKMRGEEEPGPASGDVVSIGSDFVSLRLGKLRAQLNRAADSAREIATGCRSEDEASRSHYLGTAVGFEQAREWVLQAANTLMGRA